MTIAVPETTAEFDGTLDQPVCCAVESVGHAETQQSEFITKTHTISCKHEAPVIL